MTKLQNIIIKQKYAAKMQKDYPLIEKDAVVDKKLKLTEGDLLRLMDEQNKFIGIGYYGSQNKGIGWVLSRKANEKINVAFFANKIETAITHRKALFEDPETTAFRVVNGEGDGLGGIIIDYYDGYYVIQWYSEGIYSFREDIIKALEQTVEYKGIYQKKRFDDKGKYIEEDDFVTGERGTFPLIIKENGVKFAVYLNDGAMTGIFLDQREVRQAIRKRYSNGAEMLNTFSYTGAFSVNAALGGARMTTSVDVANRSRAKTNEQFAVNNIDYETQQIVVEDVFQYFKYAARKGRLFDLVVLDPPSFAKTKKRTFSAAKDYTELLKETIAITKDEGVIVASTNSSAFNMRRFKQFIQTACKETQTSYSILEEYSLPSDFRTLRSFPEGDYLKVVFIRIKK
ncbi:class I SAM-dependent rRNA methyltransferase [Bacillus massiliigorillae]|uniref:class I SAM-dependent rRNA methyltransferase n=1 Tax=Bacillus massiliigorillae TaxID=1243664 RepID=UPI0003A0F959|nr:class I SAM-dependent rRNA methyltransferase [Bacillus massiliigorillae]